MRESHGAPVAFAFNCSSAVDAASEATLLRVVQMQVRCAFALQELLDRTFERSAQAQRRVDQHALRVKGPR
jgi:hypothetical protein